jgi:hypothetical protein
MVDCPAAIKTFVRKASINVQATKLFNPTETFICKHAFMGNKKPPSMLRMLLQDMLIAQTPIGIDLIDTNSEASEVLCSPHLFE